METGYQRGKIQEESMTFEHAKHDGSYPIVGVQHLPHPSVEKGGDPVSQKVDLIRSHRGGETVAVEPPCRVPPAPRDESGPMLERLQQA